MIKRLNDETVQVLSKPDVNEKLLNTGLEVVANSPEQMTDAIKAELSRMGKIIRDAGIKAQ